MRDRNLALTGAVGLAVLAGMLAAGLSSGKLVHLLDRGELSVEFANAAGLKPGDPVRMSGIKVGTVDSITLDDQVVLVDLKVDNDVTLGRESTAALSVETLLGTEYVALVSEGEGRLAAGERIPVERTTTPFDLQQVLGGLSERVEGLDTDRLAQAFRALSGAVDSAAPEMTAAIDGLSKISRSVSLRDRELRALLSRARILTDVLAGRSTRLVQLVRDAGSFLSVLDARREAIASLLSKSEELADQIVRTSRATRADLAPALKALRTTVDTLRENKGDIEESVRLYAPLLRYYTTVLGNGRWFDAALYGLTPKLLPADQARLEAAQ
jgi:phospholipid/cholesterol/gamma-HCH transport system substrate-binding protein